MNIQQRRNALARSMSAGPSRAHDHLRREGALQELTHLKLADECDDNWIPVGDAAGNAMETVASNMADRHRAETVREYRLIALVAVSSVAGALAGVGLWLVADHLHWIDFLRN